MSGEQISLHQKIKSRDNNKNNTRVDINVLLNKIRKDQKKQKYQNFVFIGLVSVAIVVSGIIISL